MLFIYLNNIFLWILLYTCSKTQSLNKDKKNNISC